MFQQLQQQELTSIAKLVSDFPVFDKWFEMTAQFKQIATELQAYEMASDFGPIINKSTFSAHQVAARHDNVVFVNFQQRARYAPYIIFLNNYFESPYRLEKLKAHIFPLIELCSVQKRDCRVVLATGEIIDFACGQVGPMQLNAFSSISGKKQCNPVVMNVQKLISDIHQSHLPYGELLIASSQPLTVNGVDAFTHIALSAMFINEDLFEKSELPVIEKVYFIEEAE